MEKASYLIKKLNLEKHPEGGYFRETYRSELDVSASLLEDDLEGRRSVCTSIYFLLPSEECSSFHRIKSDEIWHFYSGASLTIHMISEEGGYSTEKLGLNLENNEQPQVVVPAGVWFGAKVNQADSYSLVGCTVAPGFDFRDFELASRASLSNLYPQHTEIINQLTNS